MDQTLWMGIAVIAAVVGMTVCAFSIRRRAERLRASNLQRGGATLDVDEERAKGLYQSGWVP